MKIISGEKQFFSCNQKFDIYSNTATLFFVEEGAIYFGDRQINAGEGFFVSAFTKISYGEDGAFPCSLYSFQISVDNGDKKLKAIGFYLPCHSFTLSEPQRIMALCAALCNDGYVSLGDGFDAAAAELLVSAIIPSTDALADYGNPHINRATRYIEENFSGELKVEMLAQMLDLDRMYLRNLFVKHTGMSTMDYIMSTRMTHAKALLENGSERISAIANAVGYKDVLCFSKAFKKFTGVSPSEYRAGIRQKEVRRQRQNQVPVFIL